MNLYLIAQSIEKGYGTFDSAVVAALTNKKARETHPSAYDHSSTDWETGYGWCTSPDEVTATFLGNAKPNTEVGVICASFNAG